MIEMSDGNLSNRMHLIRQNRHISENRTAKSCFARVLLEQNTDYSYYLELPKELVMSIQHGSGKQGDWENKQTQQYSQQQGGYLDVPTNPLKRNKQSVIKKQEIQAKVVKVWHEGAD